MPCAIVAFLSLHLSFLCFGLLVQTRSTPYGLCHRPYTKAHIKGFGSFPFLHVYVCLLLCFMLVLAPLVLGFAMFDAFHGLHLVWLHLMPMRPCLGVTIWEASPNAGLLCVHLSHFSLHAMICLPCLCHPLAFCASLHAYLHVHA